MVIIIMIEIMHCRWNGYHHDWGNAGPGRVSHPAVACQVIHQSASQLNSKVQQRNGLKRPFYKRSCPSICVSRFSEDLASAPAFQGGSAEPFYQVSWILRWNHVVLFCEKVFSCRMNMNQRRCIEVKSKTSFPFKCLSILNFEDNLWIRKFTWGHK